MPLYINEEGVIERFNPSKPTWVQPEDNAVERFVVWFTKVVFG